MSGGPSNPQSSSEMLKEAESSRNDNPAHTEQLLKTVLDQPTKPQDELALRDKETALLRLGELYRDQRNTESLATLVKSSRDFMASIAKAKTAKLVRNLLGLFSDIPDSSHIQIDVTKENIDWAKSEKRIFLKQNLEVRLIALYMDTQSYKEALALINSLLRELKRLDDKMILTEVHLLESRVNHALFNLPKSKAALTAARTAANSIYCPPLLQAQLDSQSGVLHAEEKDYTTAFSYFFDTLEGYSSQNDERAVSSLKYMLLCKIMLSLPQDVTTILQSKLGQKYSGRGIEALKAVAKAHEDRSLAEFEEAMNKYQDELSGDLIIRNHLKALYDTLLEQNLMRIIEPYSRVEIGHVAALVKRQVREIESKLSQMILDGVFNGILDQNAGCLIVFENREDDKTYETTLDTIKTLGEVVQSLYDKATKLS